MQTNIFWTGREYHSMENCLLSSTVDGWDISSTIVGVYEQKIYRATWHIRTSQRWETLLAEIDYRHSNDSGFIKLESDGAGNWMLNGKEAEQFKGCIDVDIAITPFTNTLPINRLRMAEGQEQEIKVVYIDLLEQQLSALNQRYRRLSAGTYHYENIPNDFEADITVDEQGLVVDYPSLFVRTIAAESHYG